MLILSNYCYGLKEPLCLISLTYTIQSLNHHFLWDTLGNLEQDIKDDIYEEKDEKMNIEHVNKINHNGLLILENQWFFAAKNI